MFLSIYLSYLIHLNYLYLYMHIHIHTFTHKEIHMSIYIVEDHIICIIMYNVNNSTIYDFYFIWAVFKIPVSFHFLFLPAGSLDAGETTWISSAKIRTPPG